MPFTIQSLLAPSRLPPLEARILLGYVLGRDRAWLAAHPEAEVENDLATNFRALCERRAMGEPVAYVIGEREFYGLRLHVTSAVLIPRPETELLVDLALERMARETRTRVLDLGTGSGAIALAIAHERSQAEVAATDISPDALAVARQNAWRLGLRRVRFIESDWFASVPEETFDLIVSNPPYVAADDAHLRRGDVRFEPRQALAAGHDGLDALRVIAAEAPAFLAPGGWLLVEHGYDQGEACVELLQHTGLVEVSTRYDLAGLPRVTLGCKT